MRAIAVLIGIVGAVTAAHAAEDPMLGKARDAVKNVLRDPPSAKFTGLKVGTAADGSKGVCGQVNAKNAFGGMSGPQMFVWNGKNAFVLVARTGPDNPTQFDNLILGAALGEGLRYHDKFCKP